MSAIQETCGRCGQVYLSGVVGSMSWPAHECPESEMGELRARLAEAERERDELRARGLTITDALVERVAAAIYDRIDPYAETVALEDADTEAAEVYRKAALAALEDVVTPRVWMPGKAADR